MLLTDLERIIRRNLSSGAMDWLEQKISLVKTEEKTLQLNLAFSHMPGFAEKKIVELLPDEAAEIAQKLPGFDLSGWTTDRLCRVFLLTQVPDQDKEVYLRKINGLFTAAEMNEQAALYSALPLFSYPEEWVHRCEEGIRSNIGTVLEAIMYHNPYPARYLSENSWNQLVLKAFFTEKDVTRITGINERKNKALSETLKDYVQERLAAHRTVHPEIYKLIEL
jgi:hypothetical protein